MGFGASKSIMRKLLEKILFILAKLTLAKYKPKIVGITGSVGKTGAKEAIYLVLSSKFRCFRNIKSYNNEIGVPLTVLGRESAGKSFWGWLKIFLWGAALVIFPLRYPEVLVIEMGVDKPNDMDYLLSLFRPHLAVLTAIGRIPVHVEFFKGPEELGKEKAKLILGLGEKDTAILNYDDEKVREFSDQTKAHVLSFGFSQKADVWADKITFSEERINGIPKGFIYKLHYRQDVVPQRLPYVFGKHQIYATLAATACGLALDMNLVEISENLKKFKSSPGRMNLIKGIKGTWILDDSYNSSPDAAKAALEVLGELEVKGKKIAVLGDMLELGKWTEEGHREVGKEASRVADVLCVVGSVSKFISDEARRQDMAQDRIFEFRDPISCGKFIQEKILKPHDLVLVKGSQAIRTEKTVKELMAEPLKARELLVRQEEEWERR